MLLCVRQSFVSFKSRLFSMQLKYVYWISIEVVFLISFSATRTFVNYYDKNSEKREVCKERERATHLIQRPQSVLIRAGPFKPGIHFTINLFKTGAPRRDLRSLSQHS